MRKLVLTLASLIMAFSVISDAEARPRRHHHTSQQDTYVGKGTILGGRPAGCPAKFCGCGASIELFGRIIPTLNLAANWFKFPRSEPGHNKVAVRRGHVFVLKEHVQGSIWLVHDSNSGGRRTRLHQRSIAGYTIVDPSRGKLALAD